MESLWPGNSSMTGARQLYVACHGTIPDLTFNRVRFAVLSLVQVPIPRELLALKLLAQAPLLIFLVVPPAQSLVMIEYDRADGLLRTVLADHVVIDTPLQIPRVELRDTKIGLTKHGTPPGLLCGVIAGCEAGVEVL